MSLAAKASKTGHGACVTDSFALLEEGTLENTLLASIEADVGVGQTEGMRCGTGKALLCVINEALIFAAIATFIAPGTTVVWCSV